MALSVKTQAHSPTRAVAGSLAMATLMAVIVLGLGPRLAFAQVAYDEAPILVQRVASGELPPVEERLPANPLVVEPFEEIGDYGGTFRLLVRRGDWSNLARFIAYENLVRWNFDWTEIIPNVAESFEVNEDATEFVFHLREGVRWSDGEPYTADDIMFWYEDILMNPDITTVGTDIFMAGGEPGVVEKLDDYTVRISFVEPHAFFMQYMATLSGPFWAMTSFPRHFFEPYHPGYSDDADARARERGFNSGIDFLQSFFGISLRFNIGGVPVLWPWTYEFEGSPWSGQQIVLERNPYYWKVDPEGQQLPYMDSINFQILDDLEALFLRAMGGDLDFGNRNLSLESKPLFFDNMERGDYRFVDVYSSDNNAIAIALNLTHQDPVIREIFQNKDFRIGLSHAIDRQEIIDLVFLGQGVPWQPAPRPGSPVFSERLGTQYTEFNLELANEYLDRAGLTERDAQGFRLRPDGRRLSFNIDTLSGRALHFVDILDIISQQWREVGIEMHVSVIERGFFYERNENNLHDGAVWSGNGGTDALLDPRWYFPFSTESLYAVAWSNWFTGMPNAEEPPEAAKRQMELYEQIRATGDGDEQIRLMTEILEIAADEFYAFGITLPPTEFGIATNRMRNTPDWMYGAWLWPTPAPANPEQFFIAE